MRICPKQNPRFGAQAFTLVELLICTAILPFVALALAGLMSALGTAHNEMQARADAREAGWRALRLWRDDVAFASRIELGADSRAMTIVRPEKNGGETAIRYQLSPAGQFVRTTEARTDRGGPKAGLAAPKTEILSENSAGLEFRREGRAYQVQWNIEYRDGVSKRGWPQAGFAAPLIELKTAN